jgi:hypothetical protein
MKTNNNQAKVKITKKEESYGVGYPGYNVSIKIDLHGYGRLADASWPNVHGPSYSWFRSFAAAKAAYAALPEGEADLDDVVPFLVDFYLVELAGAGYRTPLILEQIGKYLAGARPDYAARVREELKLAAE